MVKIYSENGKKLQLYNILEVLEDGLELASRLKPKQYLHYQSLLQAANYEARVAAYKEMYGPKPDTVGKLWIHMQETDTLGAEIFVEMDHGVCLDNLHTTLYFSRHYPKQFDLETVLFKSSRTITKWVHFFIRKIRALKAEKIVWPEGLGYDNEDDLEIVTVSTFRCELAMRQTSLYDPDEFNDTAYVYEIGRNVSDGKVIWMEGPFSGDLSKTTIFRVFGLRDKFVEYPVLGLAGNAYMKEQILWTPGPAEDPDHDWRRELLAHHEAFFQEMRQFKILQHKYRHSKDPQMHKAIFEAIVVLCQMDLDTAPDV